MGANYKATVEDSYPLQRYSRIVGGLAAASGGLAEVSREMGGSAEGEALYERVEALDSLRVIVDRIAFASLSPEDQAKVQAQFQRWVC